jgi:hypothetical protein
MITDLLLSTPPRKKQKICSQKQISRSFFKEILNEQDESTGKWKCRCGTMRKKGGSGYSNLFSHIKNLSILTSRR